MRLTYSEIGFQGQSAALEDYSIFALVCLNFESNMSPPPEDSVSQSRMVVYVVLSILSVVGNAVTYKKMLNKYKSAEPSRRSILSSGSGALGHESAYTPHNYEFFVNQFNIVIYCAM